ncbi:hypothetical protein Taro_030819 [Colocasia esculenta]|uniref:Uncharacterized protein n=1 Tax=Colocasia esculenta TaxID=4460 RepID=A0A843W1B7_COLES|nr:hypothetical protein [Colocasia esculenta]
MPHFRELGPEPLKVPGMGLRQCGPQEWYWLDSTVSWLVLVERQLDLSSVAARLRGSSVWFVRGSFPTEPVTCEAHPYSFHVRESRRLLILHLVLSRTVAEQGLHLQQCNFLSLCTSGFYLYFYELVNGIPCEASVRSREAELDQARY